jgi:hypothetical protein
MANPSGGLKAEVRVLAALAAASWMIAVVATIDWIGGNPTAPTGVITFVLAGVVLTWAALYLRGCGRTN